MQNRLRVFAVALASATMLTGCGLFSGSDAFEPAELTRIQDRIAANVVWKTHVGRGASRTLTPMITEHGVYVAGGKTLYRLDPQTGRVIWQKRTSAPITAGVGADALYVAVGTSNGELEVYDPEGNFLWRVALSSSITVPPLVGYERVIVKTSDTRVTAFNARTGERVWHYLGQVPALTLNSFQAMSWSPAGALIPQANGRLLALSPNDGKVVFDAVVGQPKGITEVERLIDVVGRPWVDPELMCAGTYQGNVLCMQSNNGKAVWAQPLDTVSSVFSDNMGVYATDAQSHVHAFVRQTGREAWVNTDLTYRSVSAPVRVGNYLAVGDYDGVISVLNPANGEIVGRGHLSGAIVVPPLPMNYGAIFQTVEGDVAYITTRAKNP